MDQRKLGSQGLTVSALGLGCMTMSSAYGEPPDDARSERTLRRAIELGVTFFDTAETYGPYINEELVGRVLKSQRDKIILATKFGFDLTKRGARDRPGGFNGTPENARAVADASLKRLQTDRIDLFYLHRVDPAVPIEETVGAMAGLVKVGKVRYLGLSEASPANIRKAHAVHPITALQSEYSLWTRDPEAAVIPTCRALGIGFVPFSPLGRGFLTGAVPEASHLAERDMRKTLPRFQGENADRNRARVARLAEIAAKRTATSAQIALAWLLHQGEDIVPIPGTRRIERLEENMAAASLKLTAQELSAIAELFPVGAAAGARYSESGMAMLDKSRGDAPA
jgi:aryl-alcohol dehydrogenase-like predicted oxidoreductase